MNRHNLYIKCVDCQTEFIFTIGEQGFYEDHKLYPPKRCPLCRKAKKRERQDAEHRIKQEQNYERRKQHEESSENTLL